MDYTTQSLTFKLRKALRYCRLYGLRKTLIKIEGQFHMRKAYDKLPDMSPTPGNRRHVGIIGCGNFAYSHIAYYLKKNHGAVIRGVMDVNVHRAASLYEKYRATYYTTDAERVIEDPQIDIVYIASNHASHAEYAIQALNQNRHVHIEKPHVVSEDQLHRLCEAMRRSSGKVALGFNRPGSGIGRRVKRALDLQAGAAMHNWFIAGHEIAADHWYHKEEEGGRVLGNLCHWTDFIFQMVPPESRYPVVIHPTRAKQSDCDICVSYVFGDGTIGAITFSAKGHTFEGVRERYAAHRGDALISLDDFNRLVIEVVDKKRIYTTWFRDHGHEENILNSYGMTAAGGRMFEGCHPEYVWETGLLFLKTREALEGNRLVTIEKGFRVEH
jgi:predicted dehydrogenase